jgi:hypothetical protein
MKKDPGATLQGICVPGFFMDKARNLLMSRIAPTGRAFDNQGVGSFMRLQ